MAIRALYPGSFDPFTNGHLDILLRACDLFDHVIVGIGVNPNKPGFFSPEEREKIIPKAIKKPKNMSVEIFSGLTADAAKAFRCKAIVRGLRDSQDFGFEMQMAHMNRHLNGEIQTVFIPGSLAYSEISSTLVKEVSLYKGNVRGLISDFAAKELERKLRNKRSKE